MPPRLLMIVGHPRSGTTLLAEQLGRIGVAIGEETHILLNPALHRWFREGKRVPLREFAAGDRRLQRYLPAMDAIESGSDEDVWSLLLSFAEGWRDHTGGTLAGEKTPGHWRAAPRALKRLGDDVRILFTIRDPRDVVDSNRSVPWGSGDDLTTAVDWVRIHRMARRLSHKHPDRVRIHYHERFLADPNNHLKAYQEWLGHGATGDAVPELSFDPDQEPWKHDAARPPDKSRAFRWRERKAGTFRYRRIETICAGELAQTDYPLLGPPARGYQRAALIAAATIKRVGRDLERRVWIE